MEQVIDNKSVQLPNANDSMESLKARISAAEANPEAGKTHRVAADPVASTVQDPVSSTSPTGPSATPTAPPVEGKKDGLEQFKDKDGNVDDGKIRKANEHLERGIKERDELLRKNKELLAKFTKESQELAATKRDLESRQTAQPPAPPPLPANEDEEFLNRVALLENQPLELRNLIDERARLIAGNLSQRLARIEGEAILNARGMELQQLVEAGHDWIIKEGLGRFEDVFKERPFLLQSPTPYLDALKFIDSSHGSASAPAQGGTPILGGGSAVPPPSSAPAVTPEQKMGELSKQLRLLLSRGQTQDAKKVMDEMTRLNRGYEVN